LLKKIILEDNILFVNSSHSKIVSYKKSSKYISLIRVESLILKTLTLLVSYEWEF